jgi:hypothetical protein
MHGQFPPGGLFSGRSSLDLVQDMASPNTAPAFQELMLIAVAAADNDEILRAQLQR